jgi:hypothetical protein
MARLAGDQGLAVTSDHHLDPLRLLTHALLALPLRLEVFECPDVVDLDAIC